MEVRVVSLLLSLSIFSWPKPPSALAANPPGNETDRLALLDFKHRITDDPSGLMTSWNGTSTTHYCDWEGVRCSRTHPLRVVAIDLSSRGLSGTLPPSLANLTFLRDFLLPDNQFSGSIPPELGRLRRLRNLTLTSNSLAGGIPPNLSHCSSLRWLDLRFNPLRGTIPAELGSLASLDTLLLYGNNITGAIPPSLGNVSTLTRLKLSNNGLAGGVPEELGKLAGLRFLQLSVNMLSGTVPSPLYNISSLATFGLAYNQLHGSLPPAIGITLPNLRYLYFGGNRFSGALPASLSNASRLLDLDVPNNNFSGRVPSDLGRLQRGLYRLNLAWNQLEASDAGGWEFLDSLANCTQLQILNLNGNSLEGGLPRSVGNLSTQLQVLYIGSNRVSGSIPPGIQNLGNLYSLGLYNNHLTGEIPGGIGRLTKLQVLSLDRNNLTGPVPSSIGNLTQLIKLYLFANDLHGPIPSSLGKLQHLSDLDLYGNRLNGSIPREILAIPFLSFFIDLSSNALVGTLPSEVGNLTNLRQFDVSGNKLSGEIPASLGNCKDLEVLLMAENSFHGAIPPSLGSIKGLQSLDLSQNSLSGPIPAILESLPLENLDLSFNRLEGEVPTEGVFGNSTAISLAGNDGLCGGIPQLHLPPCPPKKAPGNRRRPGLLIAAIVVASAVLCSIALISVVFINRRRKSRKRAPPLPSPDEHYPKVSYHELVKATDGFSTANLLGSGRYGSVYKGSLDHGETAVAVKVFNLQQLGASKSFVTECEALRSIRHRNLVKILTSCSSVDHKGSDFKALVFEFMPNGSLEAWLHPRGEAQYCPGPLLGLRRRLDAAVDIADALEYLHHGCQTPVVHCDMKPSNILLDDRMVARVADFGLAKLISDAMIEPTQDSFGLTGLRGSIGYVAPEYGAGRQVSTSGDVYSYGILLLEMFTGKRPVDDAFKDGINLHNFVETAFPERITEIIDPLLLLSIDDEDVLDGSNARRRVEESLISVVRVGLSCANESPGERMSMRDAATELHAIRDAYNGGTNP